MRYWMIWVFMSTLGVAMGQNAEPEVVFEDQGVIYFQNGRKLQGVVRYSYVSPKAVRLDSVYHKIQYVQQFEVGEELFEKYDVLKNGKTESVYLQYESAEDAPAKLLVNAWQKTIASGTKGNYLYYIDRDYYVLFPGTDVPVYIGEEQFVPSNKQLPKQISGCKSLLTNLKKKTSGYYFDERSTIDERLQVFRNLVSDLQNCE